ncbi:hypothetical protein AB0K45_12630, partial [Micrococcus luteus]|uniref:hypothetical protein n=1 Tax=Micrococcus luteus TaxID=1270 RepID=UPI00341346C0
MRATARCGLGRGGWRSDFDEAIAMSRPVDPTTYVTIVMFKYVYGLVHGALTVDAEADLETADALSTAQQCSEDFALRAAQLTRGLVLTRTPGVEQQGWELLGEARDAAALGRFVASATLVVDMQTAEGVLAAGDVDSAITSVRGIVERQSSTGAALYRAPATELLVRALLTRGTENDVASARDVVATFAGVPCATTGRGRLALQRMRLALPAGQWTNPIGSAPAGAQASPIGSDSRRPPSPEVS